MTGQPHPGSHLGADSLSAFLEGVLPEHERQQCLAHLAECAECREAVFLARQPAPAVAEPDRVPAWRRWFAPIPVLSAAAAACALAVMIFLYVFRTPPAPHHPTIAHVEGPSQPPATPLPPPGAVTPAPQVHGRRSSHPAPPSAAPSGPLPIEGAPLKVEVARAEGLAGVIRDSSNAVIPDAHIVLSDEATRTTRETVSNGGGAFSFDNVPPGHYTLKVSASGFTTWEERGIPLSSEEARVSVPNIVLQVGGTKSEVAVVAANDVIVPTDTGQASTTLNQHMITQLSLAGRDAAELIKIMPGAAAPTTLTLNQERLMLDATGALRLSHDGGKTWESVNPSWPGKAIRLAIFVAPEPAVSGPVFLLLTDSGAWWFSLDGAQWKPVPARH